MTNRLESAMKWCVRRKAELDAELKEYHAQPQCKRIDKRYSAMKRFYSLTKADYERILISQSNKCAICGVSFPADRTGARRGPHVDHDHITLEVRGILCHKCNLMLGLAKDSIDTLNNAVSYLVNYSCQHK